MKSRYGLLWQLALILLSGVLTCSMLYAAEAQEAAKTEKKESPLALTVIEKTQRDSLLKEVQASQQELGVLFDQMLATDDEDKALGIWARARSRVSSKLKPANEKLTAWFETTRKAHNCPTCTLQGDNFTPAPLPGQTQTPAPQ